MKTTKWNVAAALGIMVLAAQAARAAAPVQTFYLPYPENQFLLGLQTVANSTTPANPVYAYISLAASADGTIIYYDQWENGFEPDIGNPTYIYSAGNPGGTQIWGDGNPANGVPPGVPTDLIKAGTVIVLNNSMSTSARGTSIFFDGGDKIAPTKGITVTKTGWASGSGTLLAGSVEVYDTQRWGTEYRAPVGESIPTGTDNDMFEYTGLYIMAGAGGATVQIDKDNNGTFETTTTLIEGQGYLVNGGVSVGGRVLSDNPVQVHLLTGDRGATYESRDSALLPVNLWHSSYITPVSTSSGDPTTIWLYNPGTSSITVVYRRRTSNTNTQTSNLTVPAGSYVAQVLSDGYGAQFYTASGAAFYAFSTTDSDSSNNSAHDWGFSLVPEDFLTPQVLVGLGLGRDPTSSTNPNENGNPVWVTPMGNGNTAVTIYVDYDGDPTTGTSTDPNGNKYNTTVSLLELARERVYDTGDLNQTGMLLYTLTPGVTLAAAWGQDPGTATDGAPGLDVGTTVLPLPLFTAGKSGALHADNDGSGQISAGDEIRYTISINNSSRAPIPDVRAQDTLPAGVSYVPNTAYFKNAAGVVTQIPDDTTGTPFPLDGAGRVLDPANPLPVNGSYEVTFRVLIDQLASLPPGTTEIVNTGWARAINLTIDFETRNPFFGSIGDRVWLDADNDGIQDAGETGVRNITVRLLNGSGVQIASALTDNNGNYRFVGLLPGNYTVQFVLPPNGYFAFSPRYATTAAADSDADQATGRSAVIALALGQTINTVDAGLYASPTLVVLSGFGARVADGNVLVHWSTASEQGTIGFFLARVDAQTGDLVYVNSEILPAATDGDGASHYELPDAGAAPGGTYSYVLIEIEESGASNRYGPFTVSLPSADGEGALQETAAPVSGSEPEPDPDVGQSPAPEQTTPEIVGMQARGRHLQLSWSSAAGARYTVERSRDRIHFEEVAVDVEATPPVNQAVIVDGADWAFYRVRAQ